ncbi:MAG: S41 family peptidase [Blastocatellia bacterium]
MNKRRILAILLVLGAALCVGAVRAQQPSPPQTVIGAAAASEKNGAIRQQTFDIVWRTVKEKHFDPTFGAVDWDKVREKYAPRAAAAKSDQELYRALQEMLSELRQSHFNIIPPEAVIPEDQKEPSNGGIGVDLRLVDGAAVITRVEPDSSAAKAGLRPGFVIKQIDDKTVEQIVESLAKSADREELKNARATRRILAATGGDPGTTVKIVYLDGQDRKSIATITREKLKGELSPKLGNFPPQYTEFEARRLPGDIGYIRFNVFVIPVMEKVKAAIREFSDAGALIFDLRGNPGGVGAMASGIAGLLTTQAATLGTMKTRTNELKFVVFPQSNPFTGPVAILIDGGSGSTSEIFSGGMQEMGRAVVIGERSAGACLPSYFQKLPTGALFQFAIADFKTPKGVLIEGRGVIPDIEVKWNRGSLLAGRDAQLDAAVEQIRQSPRKSRAVK